MRTVLVLWTLSLSLLLPLARADPFDTTALQPAEGVYYGVWNGTGPVVTDVKQLSVLNCWWDASSLAVLIASQNWIENLLHYGNGSPMVGAFWPSDASVNVTTFRSDTGQAVSRIASVYNKGRTEDHYAGNWWHDALGQAVLQVGTRVETEGILMNGTWDPDYGSAVTGLKLLTGYDTSYNSTTSYGNDIDSFFADLSRATTGTPVIFNTCSQDAMGVTTPQLGYNHDYAVYNGTDYGNGTRTIWARNPWGSTDEFDLMAVFNNTEKIIFLEGWQVLQWPGR